MTFDEYMILKARAKKVGEENHPALKQLLHLIQAQRVAQSYYKKYTAEMNEWQKTCANTVIEHIANMEKNSEVKQ